MRAIVVAGFVVLFSSAAALAQAPAPSGTPAAGAPVPAPPTASAPPARSARGGDITRDEYIERAVERARSAAEKRFDQMDTNHDGVLTADERRAAREERAERRSSRSQ